MFLATTVITIIAFIRIFMLREFMFIYFKVLMVAAIFCMLFKIVGMLSGEKIFTRFYLSGIMFAVMMLAAQLNRVTLRNVMINLVNSILFTASVIEVFTVPDSMIDPVYTVLPIRNIVIVIFAIEIFAFAIFLVPRIKIFKKSFGGLVKWEEHFGAALIFEAFMLMVASFTYLYSLVYGVGEEFIIFNAVYIFVMSLLFLHMMLVLSSTPFFVVFSGIEGIAVMVGGVTLASIGNVSGRLIVALENSQANTLKVIAKDKILIYWRTRIKAGGSIRRLSIMMVGTKLEKNTEEFFSLLSSRIKDRILRDYLLTQKLVDIDYVVRQIESMLPPRFLREEFEYAIEKFREIL